VQGNPSPVDANEALETEEIHTTASTGNAAARFEDRSGNQGESEAAEMFASILLERALGHLDSGGTPKALADYTAVIGMKEAPAGLKATASHRVGR
jgi:hypothetical protein